MNIKNIKTSNLLYFVLLTLFILSMFFIYIFTKLDIESDKREIILKTELDSKVLASKISSMIEIVELIVTSFSDSLVLDNDNINKELKEIIKKRTQYYQEIVKLSILDSNGITLYNLGASENSYDIIYNKHVENSLKFSIDKSKNLNNLIISRSIRLNNNKISYLVIIEIETFTNDIYEGLENNYSKIMLLDKSYNLISSKNIKDDNDSISKKILEDIRSNSNIIGGSYNIIKKNNIFSFHQLLKYPFFVVLESKFIVENTRVYLYSKFIVMIVLIFYIIMAFILYYLNKQEALKKVTNKKHLEELTQANNLLSDKVTELEIVKILYTESEFKFKHAIEESPLPIMVYAEDGEVITLSNSWSDLSGYKKADIPNISDWKSKIISDEEFTYPNIDLLPEHVENSGEYSVKCKSGKILIWDFSNVSIGVLADRRKIVMIVASDITERVNSDQQITKSELRLRTIVEQAPFGIVVANSMNDLIIESNNNYSKLLGLSKNEIYNMEFSSFIYKEDYNDYIKNISLLKNKLIEYFQMESRCYHKNGSLLYIKIKAVPILVSEINVINYLIIIEDITKLKKIEEDKMTLLKQLNHESKMDSFGQIAGGIAHDFNNILNGILGSLELLKLNNKKKYVDLIEKSTLRGAELTKKLLMFTRKSNVSMGELNLKNIIVDTVDILKNTVDKSINISLDYCPGDYNITGDLSAMQSTFMNIGINASLSISGNGKIKYLIDKEYLDENYCKQSMFNIDAGEYIKISITDTGSGIKKEYLDRIFDPFFTTRKLGQGTGLGLSVTYGAIAEHKGEITVNSIVDIGSIFTIYLPVLPIVSCIDNKESDEKVGSGTILFVDDEEINRVVGKELLENLGYKVLLASSGEESIDIYTNNSQDIDLLITDNMMQEMTGVELVHKLREENQRCKVIFVTGNTVPLESYENEITSIIQKPYKVNELSILISQLLDIQS